MDKSSSVIGTTLIRRCAFLNCFEAFAEVAYAAQCEVCVYSCKNEAVSCLESVHELKAKVASRLLSTSQLSLRKSQKLEHLVDSEAGWEARTDLLGLLEPVPKRSFRTSGIEVLIAW